MRTHELTIWNFHFQDVLDGRKNFELRLIDRDYKIGDMLQLTEVDPCNNLAPTGRKHCVELVYMVTGEHWGLQRYYAVLGFK
jgi:Domain of unknown function (DUF3850)